MYHHLSVRKVGLKLSFVLFVSLLPLFMGVIPVSAQDLAIGPRVGLSTFTGVAGIELQANHIAFDVGYLPLEEWSIFTGGTKYYSTPYENSWFVGLCVLKANAKSDVQDETSFVLGAGGGYRWKFSDRWNFSLAAGGGVEQYKAPDLEETRFFPVLDLTLGYSFGGKPPSKAPPTPTPTPTPSLPPTPTPTPTPPPTPTPTPTPRPDALLSITVTSKIPVETERETLSIDVVVTSENGVQNVTITIRKPGTKGLVIDTMGEGEQEPQQQFTFSREIPLEIGHNELVVEAIDTMGQVAQQTFSVFRTDTTAIPAEIPSDLRQRAENVYAVIIGIGDYQDAQLDLRFTVNDAQGLYDVLTDPLYGSIPKDHIRLLLNEEATDRNIKRAIGTWLRRQAKEDDTVIIYYSGHGAQEEGDTYWVTYNADINDLYSTALSNNEIYTMLGRIQSKRVITFLDSCYSAATVKRKDQTRVPLIRIPWEKFSGEGRVVISASDGKQLSLELDEYQHGVFTYYLLEGLKGEADTTPRDGVIEVEEIWNYIKRRVTDTAQKAGNPQNPVFQGEITAGIPLILNLSILWERQQHQVKKKKQEKLQELYEQGLIRPEDFDCAFKLLDSGKPNRYLEDLLSGKITPETFNRFFQCDDQR